MIIELFVIIIDVYCCISILIQLTLKNSVYKFIKAVNSVSHSPKTANIFLIRSRMTDFKLEWTWAYEAPLQGNFLLCWNSIIIENYSSKGADIDGCPFERQLLNWHLNSNCIWRNLNTHQNRRPAVFRYLHGDQGMRAWVG